MKAENALPAWHRVTAPESKVARCAQLCASHWVQGSPLPPAAQAISPSLIELPRRRMHSVRRDLRARTLQRLGPPIVLPLAVPHAAEMRQHLAAEQIDILDRQLMRHRSDLQQHHQ